MSNDISSSDSENEDHQETSENSQEQHNRVSSYKCPADFVSFQYNSSAIGLSDSDEHKELWLIKTPSRFDPKIFTDLKVPLSGLKMIQETGATPQLYSVLGSSSAPPDFHLLTYSCKNQNTLSASRFTGILGINESYGDYMGNQRRHSIPTVPAPCVPPGLRQRFQPFGSSKATPAGGTNTLASPSPLKRVKLDLEGCDEQRKKKKKKKKERHVKEDAEVLNIKQEQMAHDYGDIGVPEAVEEGGLVEGRKKKKKKRKEKGLENRPDEEVAVDANLIAKQEPLDTSYGDIDGSVKKKKKKKKKLDE